MVRSVMFRVLIAVFTAVGLIFLAILKAILDCILGFCILIRGSEVEELIFSDPLIACIARSLAFRLVVGGSGSEGSTSSAWFITCMDCSLDFRVLAICHVVDLTSLTKAGVTSRDEGILLAGIRSLSLNDVVLDGRCISLVKRLPMAWGLCSMPRYPGWLELRPLVE
jgi:hypothetical protein